MIKPKELRKRILELAIKYDNGHIASAYSCVEILIAIYTIMGRNDKFIMSKGHGCLALYSILQELGFNPDLSKGHPDIDVRNGIECTTGSLGHGLPVAVGMALSRKLTNTSGNIYVLLGDGECQEGTTWESLMVASQHKLDNLIIIIDNNKIQALDYVENILNIYPLIEKFEAFGGAVMCEIDGHDIISLTEELTFGFKDKPSIIIANTIKGKGLECMEDKPEWHNKLPTKEDL